MQNIVTSVRMVLVTVVVCCVAYTATVWAVGKVLVPDKAEGSMVRDARGQIIGSSRIAQKFVLPHYIWPRPSAVDYNAAGTGGSNLAPTNPALTERAKESVTALAPAAGQRVPADLVAASGSGMDPHITLAAARFQAPRVAAARGIDPARVVQVIDRVATSPGGLGLGDQIVNVLELNLALDRQFGTLPLPPAPREPEPQ